MPEIRVIILQKIRKKKDMFKCSFRRKVKLDSPMYSKQTNKMWPLKSLIMLKCESGTTLHAVQYK